jgi:branched-chain amino acid transport system substrate-binding protein
MRRPRTLLAAAGAAALAACSRPAPAPVTLAVIAPLSGTLSADGRGLVRAATMAVEDARAAGALPRDAAIRAFDDRGDPDAAADAARDAAADPQVFAVLGPLTSGCAIRAARVLGPAGVPMITPSATAPELTLQQTRPDWRGARVVFRLPPSDAVQGESDAAYAFHRLGLRRMAVLHDGTAYGLGLAESFLRAFTGMGGTVGTFLRIEPGRTDLAAPSSALAQDAPDGVFYGGVYTDAGRLLAQSRAAGFRGVFMSGDGAKSRDFFKYAWDAADGAYLSVSGVPLELLPSAADFVKRYRARWGGDDPRTFDHYAYAAADIALDALRRSGGDRKAALGEIRRGRHEEMMGTFLFDAKGDSLKSLITMMKADGRRKVFVPAY